MAIGRFAWNAAIIAWEPPPAAMCSYLVARRDSVQEVEEVLADPVQVGGFRREFNKGRHDDHKDDQDDCDPDCNSYGHFDPRRTIGGFASQFVGQ